MLACSRWTELAETVSSSWRYQGQLYSLSALAQLLTGSKYSVAGPRYFKYKGEWLNDIRHRLERA